MMVFVLDKPSSLSSVYEHTNMNHPFSAAYANDGIYIPPVDDEFYLSTASSKLETNPWWMVNLEAFHCVTQIRILNRCKLNIQQKP